MALMDFHPLNPQDSTLVREVPGLPELSKRVLIVAGPTAAGKDTVVDSFIKMRLKIPITEEIDRDKLLAKASDFGIHRMVKITGRGLRVEEEIDGVSYHFYDGGDFVRDARGAILTRDFDGKPIKDGSRPTEDILLGIRNKEDSPLAYSYKYADSYYAFPANAIPPEVSEKPWPMEGIKELLEEPETKMLILPSGTTPEVLYLLNLLPNATALYIIPDRRSRAIVTLERQLRKRWWARELGMLKKNVVEGGEKGWPPDPTGFADHVEEAARHRFHEVTPQMTLALICGEQLPRFHIIPNIQGLDYLRQTSQRLEYTLKAGGNFPRLFQQ